MDIREARDQAVLFGMDVFEGVTASMTAFGAFVTSYCVYEGVSDMFQPDLSDESSLLTAAPGALIMTGIMYGAVRITQTGREVLEEHRARRQSLVNPRDIW
jgi:hypothetical protein